MASSSDHEVQMSDVDFNVAGTRDGITALQMDNKKHGIPISIVQRVLNQAKDGRVQILKQMDKVLNQETHVSDCHFFGSYL